MSKRQTEYNIPSWGIFEASASKHGIALRWGHSIFNFEALRTHSCWGVARGRGSYPSSIGRPRPPCWLRTEVSVQSTWCSAISTKRKRLVFANVGGWRWFYSRLTLFLVNLHVLFIIAIGFCSRKFIFLFELFCKETLNDWKKKICLSILFPNNFIDESRQRWHGSITFRELNLLLFLRNWHFAKYSEYCTLARLKCSIAFLYYKIRLTLKPMEQI